MLQECDDEGEGEADRQPEDNAECQGMHLARKNSYEDSGDHALDGRSENDSDDSSPDRRGKPGGEPIEDSQEFRPKPIPTRFYSPLSPEES